VIADSAPSPRNCGLASGSGGASGLNAGFCPRFDGIAVITDPESSTNVADTPVVYVVSIGEPPPKKLSTKMFA